MDKKLKKLSSLINKNKRELSGVQESYSNLEGRVAVAKNIDDQKKGF